MKFRYLIVEDAGRVTGTDSEQHAQQAASDDSNLAVIDTEAGFDLVGAYPIEQQTTYAA